MIAGIVATVILLSSLSLVASALVAWWKQWPEPTSERRRCALCSSTAADDRWMGLHMAAQHPEVYEPAWAVMEQGGAS